MTYETREEMPEVTETSEAQRRSFRLSRTWFEVKISSTTP